MIDYIAYTLVAIGLVAAVIIYARQPSFWIEFGWRVFVKLAPYIWKYIAKRMTPEEEAAMQKCFRSGGTWDPVRKKCKDR